MPVIVNKTEGRYVVASRNIVEDRNLSMKDRGLLLTLISLPHEWSFTSAGIASILPDGYDAVNAGIKRLIEAGYVRRTQERKGGKYADIKLEVYDSPFRENPQTDKPLTEKSATGKPLTENPQQLNTNILNTNKSNNKGLSVSADATVTGKDKKNESKKYTGNKRSKENPHNWSDAERDLYGI